MSSSGAERATRAEQQPSRDDDWYLVAVNNVHGAAEALHAAVDYIDNGLLETRRERLAGAPVSDIAGGLAARGGRMRRIAATAAFREFEAALTACRAGMIRVLVDDEQQSFSEVAKLFGVSRQMVARLYRIANEGPDPKA